MQMGMLHSFAGKFLLVGALFWVSDSEGGSGDGVTLASWNGGGYSAPMWSEDGRGGWEGKGREGKGAPDGGARNRKGWCVGWGVGYVVGWGVG